MYRPLTLLCALATGACHSYAPAPVDLAAHAAAFAARLPDPASLQAALPAASAEVPVDLHDGIDRREARWIAICFHPDCRLARARAGVAAADRDHAGTLPDPVLGLDVARILETVPHRWVVEASLGFTLPINGRLGLEQQLAAAGFDEALVAGYVAERAAADAVDAAWVRWSSEHARAAELADLCARLRDLEAVAQRLAEAGALMQQEARVFALELARRELELAAAQDAAAAGELELRQRLGLHPQAPVSFVPDLAVAPHLADAAARTSTLATSPRLLPLAAAHRRAERALELAVRMQWPDLTLAPGWQEEDGQPRAALGLSLPLPLWAGNDRAIARATAERALAAEALRSGQEVAVQELAAAELRWTQTARRSTQVRDRLVPLADRQIDDCRRLAELGQLEPLLLLDALVRVHDARMAALQATQDEALAVVALNERCGLPTPPPAADGASR